MLRLRFYRYLARHGTATASRRVKLLPFGLVLKYNPRRNGLIEADNTHFVADHTRIPVPQILDIIPFSEYNEQLCAMLMTRIEGQPLDQWLFAGHVIRPPGSAELIEEMKMLMYSDTGSDALLEVLAKIKNTPPPTVILSDCEGLIADLRAAFQELRSLPPPASGIVSGLSGRPVLSCRCGDTKPMGPCDQQEFKDAIFAQAGFQHRLPGLRRLAEPVNAKVHQVCFTHADLAGRNVMVGKDGRVAGIVDWETAGWHPEYWERTMMEFQMLHEPVMQQFWDAAQLFGPDAYEEELALEWALWGCTGMTAVANESGDDLSCPR